MGNTWYSVSKLTLFVHHFTPVFSLFSGGTALCMMVRLNSHAGLRSFIPNIIQMLFRLVDHPTSCLVVFFSLLYIIKAIYWKRPNGSIPGLGEFLTFLTWTRQIHPQPNTYILLFFPQRQLRHHHHDPLMSTPFHRSRRGRRTTIFTLRSLLRIGSTHKALFQNHQANRLWGSGIPPPIALVTLLPMSRPCRRQPPISRMMKIWGVHHWTTRISLLLPSKRGPFQ